MSEPTPNIWKRIGLTIDLTRRVVLNTLFVAVILALLVFWLWDDRPRVPDPAALILDPRGVIVEQASHDPMNQALDLLTGNQTPQTVLKDLLDAVDQAGNDSRIRALVLDLGRLESAGLSKLQDLRTAVLAFRARGKPVIALADTLNQHGYYLASAADEILLHRQGSLMIEGYGRYGMYYKDLLNRWEIDWHVFRVGEYKSAVEPYLRDGMSPEAREANLAYLNEQWRTWLEGVAEARGMDPEELRRYVDEQPRRVQAAGGSVAEAAHQAGLVDRLVDRDEMRQRLIDLVGEDPASQSFRQIRYAAYLQARDEDRWGRGASGNLVGVVVAAGPIQGGTRPPGAIGGDSTAALIRTARRDDSIKALVLRVDSPGGSAFASEVIRRELELTRLAGKPVVVSMGSLAASGGYWISMAADEIWASPVTITGSIGIFGMFPNYHKPLARHLGIRVDGVGTTPLAGGMRPDRPLNPDLADVLQRVIDRGYQDFLAVVAKGRDMTPEQVDRVGRGRVWSGRDAQAHGLVDHLGGLTEALRSAARLAGVESDYRVRYLQREPSFRERLIARFLTEASTLLAAGHDGGPPGVLTGAARRWAEEAIRLSQLDDPRGVYAYCPLVID